MFEQTFVFHALNPTKQAVWFVQKHYEMVIVCLTKGGIGRLRYRLPIKSMQLVLRSLYIVAFRMIVVEHRVWYKSDNRCAELSPYFRNWQQLFCCKLSQSIVPDARCTSGRDTACKSTQKKIAAIKMAMDPNRNEIMDAWLRYRSGA